MPRAIFSLQRRVTQPPRIYVAEVEATAGCESAVSATVEVRKKSKRYPAGLAAARIRRP